MALLAGPVVAPEDLPALLAEGARLVDARPRAAWLEGHLSGAVSADLERDLSAPEDDPAAGGRHPLPALSAWCRRLGQWGVAPELPVVVYDAAGGANAAARAWWMFRAAGHDAVAVLDGGISAAVEAGLGTDTDEPELQECAPYPSPPGGAWALPTLSASEVEALRSDPDVCLFDVRSAERYRGESDPFDPNPGHVPGALNVPYGENLTDSGRFRGAAELRALYEQRLAGRSPERTVVYCGSGVTACHTLLALERAGLRGASLYVGSWSEWGRSGRPRATVLS